MNQIFFCPYGGDETHCEECVYYPDYEWSEEDGDCLRRAEQSGE